MRADDAGGDAVDANVVWPELDGEVAGKLEIGGFRQIICADGGRAAVAPYGGDQDDDAVVARHHLGRDELREPVTAENVVAQDLLELFVRDVRHRSVIG